MIFKRYANPSEIIGQMLKCGRFSEWVIEFIKIYNDEITNEELWDAWLHKSFDKTFLEFKNLCMSNIENAQQNIDFETTASKSKEMLNSFIPPQ